MRLFVILSLLQGIAWTAFTGPRQVTSHDKAVYLNASLSASERATDLLQRMTWEEKIGQLGGIRRALTRSNGEVTFNRTSFEMTRKTQNGQIGQYTN